MSRCKLNELVKQKLRRQRASSWRKLFYSKEVTGIHPDNLQGTEGMAGMSLVDVDRSLGYYGYCIGYAKPCDKPCMASPPFILHILPNGQDPSSAAPRAGTPAVA